MKVAKKISDKDRLDFLIKYRASAPLQDLDHNWTLFIAKSNKVHSFTGTTPRMAIDLALCKLEPRKIYTYKLKVDRL